MADTSYVVAHSPIYTAKGIKLIDSGVRIDRRLHERLIQVPLRDAIENNLRTEDMVSAASLEAAARAECGKMGWFVRLRLQPEAIDRLLAPLRAVPLSMPMAFKLTLMRSQRPVLFSHSLQMTLVALYLAQESDLSEREYVHVATAALLHEIGMLYLSPSWDDVSHKLSPAERRELLSHSITGMFLLQQEDLYPLSVPLAVLEHHERMDGSGYPRALQGTQISPIGQILLLADVVVAFHEKYADQAGLRLSLMLRMNHRQFPADLVQIILPTLGGMGHSIRREQIDAMLAEVRALGSQLLERFAHWERLRAGLPANASSLPLGESVQWLDLKLKDLRKELSQAGLHPEHLSYLLDSLQGDAQCIADMALLQREALWQMDMFASCCLRDWPQVLERSGPVATALADWCQASNYFVARA